MNGSDSESDSVARGIRAWLDLQPDLDLAGTEVVARAVRLASLAEARIVPVLRRFGLTFHGYSVLAVLRSADAHGEVLKATQIAERSHLSSGGLTNLLHRLEADGLILRRADPIDGRATVVALTGPGRDVADAAVRAVASEERALISGVPAGDRRQLARLLSRVLSSLE